MTLAFFGIVSGVFATLVLYGLLTVAALIDCPPVWLAAKAAGTGALGAVCVPLVYGATERLDRVVGNIRRQEAIHDF